MSVRRIASALPPVLSLIATLATGTVVHADGVGAIEAGSSRQQSLLEHRLQLLESLRERVSALNEERSRAVARVADLEREIVARDAAALERETTLESDLDEQRRRADAAAEEMAVLETELAGQRRRFEETTRENASGARELDALRARVDALENVRERTLATLKRHGVDESTLDEELDALAALRESRETLRTRFVDSERREASLDEALVTAETRVASLESQLETALARTESLERERERLVAVRAEPRGDTDGRAGGGEPERGEREGLERAAKANADVASPSDVSRIESADDLVLSARWYVPSDGEAPSGYMDRDALGAAEELPAANVCETFADGAASDADALAKLEVNGFPVTAFWVRSDDGLPGICRLVPRASGGFEARLSSLAVLRGERAIVATRRETER